MERPLAMHKKLLTIGDTEEGLLRRLCEKYPRQSMADFIYAAIRDYGPRALQYGIDGNLAPLADSQRVILDQLRTAVADVLKGARPPRAKWTEEQRQRFRQIIHQDPHANADNYTWNADERVWCLVNR